jgi:hypothetical protein
MAHPQIARTLRTRWWTFFYRRCLTGLPWFWPARPPGVPAMVTARRMARRHFGRDHHPVYRALAQVLAAIVWPPAVLIHVWEIRSSRGPEAVPIKRVPGALWAAMRHNVLPGEYYGYALWQPDRKANIDNYFYSQEGTRVLRLLNRPIQPNPIDDKLAFHEMCKAYSLPSPEILAVFTPTCKLLDFESGRPPKRDLFVKARNSLGSDGAERFRCHGVVFESSRGSRVRPEDLEVYLATRARTEQRTLLVQPALANHPRLHLSENAGLAAARLVTGLSPDGKVIAIYGQLNYFGHTYQTPALIDVANGRLMPTPSSTGSAAQHSKHQVGNGSNNCTLPDWDAALQHAKAAHRICSNFAFIGWDIAFTNQGPMLLEGNANWCAADYQRLSGQPLGSTEFADILAARLRDL